MAYFKYILMKKMTIILLLAVIFISNDVNAGTQTASDNTLLYSLLFIFVCIPSVIILYSKFSNNQSNNILEQNNNNEWKEIRIDIGSIILSGVSNKNIDGSSRQRIIRKCVRLSNEHSDHDVIIHAEFERVNEYDENTIKVEATESWTLRNGDTKEKYLGVIGYIPKEVASDIHDKISKLPYPIYLNINNVSFKEVISDEGKQLVGVKLSIYLETYINKSKKPDDNTTRCPYCWADCSNTNNSDLCSVCGHELNQKLL